MSDWSPSVVHFPWGANTSCQNLQLVPGSQTETRAAAQEESSPGMGQKSIPSFIIISNPLSPGARPTEDGNWAVGLFPNLYLYHQERRKTLESKYILNSNSKNVLEVYMQMQ